jgi:hypothetical protein
VSEVVQGLPSSHAVAAGALVWPQPEPAAQLSTVHALPSSQFSAGPPTHPPPAHWSAVVHALPSSQLSELAVLLQPLSATHASVVHGLPSSQLGVVAPGKQTPPPQLSPMVQAFLSASHGVPSVTLAVAHLPDLGSHVLMLHAVLAPASHVTTLAGLSWHVHRPPLSLTHCKVPLHALPSSYAAHEAASPGVHVHTLPPGWHTPDWQKSLPVHALPSSHGPVWALWVQPALAVQLSAVHGLSSSHAPAARGVPAHAPPAHVSALVHASPSSHGPAVLA